MTQTGSGRGPPDDWISLGALASWVPQDALDEAVGVTGKAAKRKSGKLPPHVMVYLRWRWPCSLRRTTYSAAEVWHNYSGTAIFRPSATPVYYPIW